jgi:hypothetical protein
MGKNVPRVKLYRRVKRDPHTRVELAIDGDLDTVWRAGTSNRTPRETLTIEEANRLMSDGLVVFVDGKPIDLLTL